MTKKHIFLFLLIIGTAFWGVSFTFVKVAINGGSAFVFLFYKFLIATVCLGLIFIRQLRFITRRTILIGTLIGIPLFIGTLLQTIGLKYTTVSNAAFITGLDVILIPILKFLIYRKKVLPKIWLSCCLAIAGLYIIVIKDGLSLNYGDLWMIACAFGFAFYVLQVGKYANEERPMPAVIILLLFCTGGCLLLALCDSSSVWLPEADNFWYGVFFAAVPATAYMYGVQNAGQRYLGEEKVAMTYLFEPVFATIAGILILKENMTYEVVAGGVLIITAMFIAELDFKKLTSAK